VDAFIHDFSKAPGANRHVDVFLRRILNPDRPIDRAGGTLKPETKNP
jgi:hypothetical protein